MTERRAAAQIQGGGVNVTTKEKHSEPGTHFCVSLLQYITEFIVPVTKFLY